MTLSEQNARGLCIVIPVFNEEESVSKVIDEWDAEISRHTRDFLLLVINDGSTDGTTQVLERLQAQLGPRLKIIHHTNRGHGQSCLAGYRWAVTERYCFVLQVDSDGQSDPQFFRDVWSRRNDFDVLYGRRVTRDDGWRRALASRIVKWVVWAVNHVWCVDPNVPYRLMRTEMLPPLLPRIPGDFNLANVALAVLLKKSPGVRHGAVPINFRKRYGGQPKVRLGQFGGKARELVRQLRSLNRNSP
jgi:dolichol-phosphate mannosyltransferase